MSDPITKFLQNFEDDNFIFIPEYDWRQLGPFNRLARDHSWDQRRRNEEYINLQDSWKAFVEEEFGDISEVEAYRKLCKDLDIYPVPESKSGCETELRRIHVNLVDVIQCKWDERMGRGASEVTKFRNAAEAKEYAKEEHKILPGYIGRIGVLRVLLR
jgi:hypothetical protein